MPGKTRPIRTLMRLLTVLFCIHLPGAYALSSFEWMVVVDANSGSGYNGPNYFEVRGNFLGELERAREAVRACGDCASARAELDALLAEEDTFQRSAGQYLGMMGAPPSVARYFGIRTDSLEYNYPSVAWGLQAEAMVNTNPAWLADAPEFCREPVRAHLKALKSYQTRNNIGDTSSVTVPGGAFYESHRLHHACKMQDYREFERLRAIAKARAGGEIIPEIDPIGYGGAPDAGTVYFGDVADDFPMPLPPPKDIRSRLDAAGLYEIRFIANKQTNGTLTQAIVTNFSPGTQLSPREFDQCMDIPRPERTERQKRVCEDQSEIRRFDPKVLACAYRDTTPSGDISRRYALYWYDERVPLAQLDYLLTRDHAHSLLEIRGPRTDCPLTWEAAQAVSTDYEAQLQALRARHPQTPMTMVLPVSEYLRKQREDYQAAYRAHQARLERTAAYDWSGYYRLTSGQAPDGSFRAHGRKGAAANGPVDAECIVAGIPNVAKLYRAACWSQARTSVGEGLELSGYVLRMDFVPVNRFLLEPGRSDRLTSDEGGSVFSLTRKGDLFAFGEYPLEGDYLLRLAHGDEYLRAFCTFSRPAGGRFYTLDCADEQGRHLKSTRQMNASDANARMLEIGGLSHFPTWEHKYHSRPQRITLDGIDIDGLFVIIDPRFTGDNLRDAQLLAFGGENVTGSLQRLELSDLKVAGDETADRVTGRWVGKFKCEVPHEREAELHLVDRGHGRFRGVSGTFVFRDTARGELGNGSYQVNGEYLDDIGAMRLRPGEWVGEQNYRYNAAGLFAAALWPGAADGEVRLSGDLVDRACGALELTRVSEIPPDQPAVAVVEEPAAATITPPQQHAESPAVCSIGRLAGAYSTSYGDMDCASDGGELSCCYSRKGNECAKWIQVALSDDRRRVTGEWRYSNGSHGAAEFGVSDSCSLTDGRWGYAEPTGAWSVSRR